MKKRFKLNHWAACVALGLAALVAWTGIGEMTGPSEAAAESKAKIIVDGNELRLDGAEPIHADGRLLVPMRPIFEALGAELTWSPFTRTVTASKANTRVLLKVGRREAWVNGEQVLLDAPPSIVGGRTMVPLRFVATALGADVLWNGAQQTALIRSDAHDETYRHSQAGGADAALRAEMAKIQAEWEKRKPRFSGNPYAVEPTVEAPYASGSLQSGFIRDGVEMANFVRLLAGLPADLQATDALNKQAQHGAVLLAAHGALTHEPPRPAKMSEAFYEQGYAATTTSNIAYIAASSGEPLDWAYERMEPDSDFSLAASVINYMRDEDEMNIDRVGHRRWILNPSLQYVGFGTAHRSAKSGNRHELHLFSAMKVFDASRRAEPEYDMIRWPNEGAFPTQFFQGNDPWSISFHPERYRKPVLEELTVALTRSSDGRTWTIDGADPGEHYMNVNNDPYGVPYCLIFRPSGIRAYGNGEEWSVSVQGMRTMDGRPAEVAYRVSFFDMMP